MEHAADLRERLARFVTLLLTWNRTVNLISRVDEAQVWSRHVADSLQLVPFVPTGVERAIDIGSGAGFPGLLLAMATRVRWCLIEADARKASFLREAARLTATSAEIYASRAETTKLPPAGLVTSRGCAPLPRLFELATPLLAPGGVCVFQKGRMIETELLEARRKWDFTAESWPSKTASGSVTLRITKLAATKLDRQRAKSTSCV